MIADELGRRLKYLLFRDRYTAELEEELRFHIDQRVETLHRDGMPLGAARLAARRRFGNITNLQERSRDMWGLTLLEHAIADVRFAVRRLRLRPGFSIATIAVIALGIGATTAVFSAIDAALIRPLPFPHAEQLYTLTSVSIPFDPGINRPTQRHVVDINDVANMRDVFADVGAFAAGGLNLSDPANPRRLRAGVVTPGFFPALGVRTQLGRTFDGAEGRPGGPRSVILADALWRSRFGASDVLGKTIDLNGTAYTVIGIMPPGFSFPNESDIWIPLTVPTTFETFAPFRGFLPSQVIARTAAGISGEMASRRLLTMWERFLAPTKPGEREGFSDIMETVRARGAARPLQETLVGDRRRALVILMGATALLLLIACANVANLLLSDAASRRREVALREVLGASRGRIVRQLLAESMLLALAGAAVGIASSPVILGVLRAMMPANLAGVAAVGLDLRVLGFAAGVAVATGVFFGLWPALSAMREDAADAIKASSAGLSASRLGIARRGLIATELALTTMLLVGSGLMLRSLERVLSQDRGIVSEQVGTLELSFAKGLKTPERRAQIQAIVGRLEQDPQISSAAIVNDLPLRGGGGIALSITVDGAPELPREPEMRFARYLLTTRDYFETMGIPFVRGGTFGASRDSLSPPVAVINTTMARQYWPNADPVGKSFKFPGSDAPITVVGVVADVRENLERDAGAQMYFPVEQETPQNAAIVARSTLPPAALLARLTEAVRAVNPAQAVYNVRMMDEVVSKSVAPRRMNTMLIALFGALALVLSAFGVYAVVSYSVARRAREFGIRTALGATGGHIARLVGGEMLSTVAVGLAAGVIGAWLLTRVMSSLLYGVEAHDALTFAAVPFLLIIPAALATLVPTRRAMRLDPTEVMRAE